MFLSQNNKRRGSILLEALLSVVILSVGITVIIQAMTSSLRATTYNAGYAQALMLMENKLFDIVQSETVEGLVGQENRFESPFDQFSYSLDISEIESLSEDQLVSLELDVFWKSGIKSSSIKINTYHFNQPDEETK